jgi:hypothetical protein
MRNGLLLEALGKPIDLNAVDWHVRHRNPSASPSDVQNETWLSLTAKGRELAQCLEDKDIDLYRGRRG